MTSGPGESGYVNAVISVTIGGSYLGQGNGYSGGTPYTFAVRMRSFDDQVQRQEVTDAAFSDAVPGPSKLIWEGEGYFKGTAYPPLGLITYVRIQCNIIFNFDAVILIESFKPVGVIEEGVKYSFRGASVGPYTVNP